MLTDARRKQGQGQAPSSARLATTRITRIVFSRQKLLAVKLHTGNIALIPK